MINFGFTELKSGCYIVFYWLHFSFSLNIWCWVRLLHRNWCLHVCLHYWCVWNSRGLGWKKKLRRNFINRIKPKEIAVRKPPTRLDWQHIAGKCRVKAPKTETNSITKREIQLFQNFTAAEHVCFSIRSSCTSVRGNRRSICNISCRSNQLLPLALQLAFLYCSTNKIWFGFDFARPHITKKLNVLGPGKMSLYYCKGQKVLGGDCSWTTTNKHMRGWDNRRSQRKDIILYLLNLEDPNNVSFFCFVLFYLLLLLCVCVCVFKQLVNVGRSTSCFNFPPHCKSKIFHVVCDVEWQCDMQILLEENYI